MSGWRRSCKFWHSFLIMKLPLRKKRRLLVLRESVNGSGNVSGTETPLSEKNFVLPPSVDKIVPPPTGS